MISLEECIAEMEKVYERMERYGCFYCPFQFECRYGDCYVKDIHQYLKERLEIGEKNEVN